MHNMDVSIILLAFHSMNIPKSLQTQVSILMYSSLSPSPSISNLLIILLNENLIFLSPKGTSEINTHCVFDYITIYTFTFFGHGIEIRKRCPLLEKIKYNKN